MIKRFVVAAAAVVLSASLAFAVPVKAKVTAIDGKKVRSSWSTRRPTG